GCQVGKNKSIWLELYQVTERESFVEQIIVQRKVGLHFPVYNKVWMISAQNSGGLLHFYSLRLIGRPKIAVRKQGNFWLHIYSFQCVGSLQGNVYNVFYTGVIIDGGVGKKHRAFFAQHNIHTCHFFGVAISTNKLKKWFYYLGIFSRKPRYKSIGFASFEHGGTKIISVPYLFSGVKKCYTFSLPFFKKNLCIAFGTVGAVKSVKNR